MLYMGVFDVSLDQMSQFFAQRGADWSSVHGRSMVAQWSPDYFGRPPFPTARRAVGKGGRLFI